MQFKTELSLNDVMISVPLTPESTQKRELEEQVLPYHQMNRYYYIGGTIFVYLIEFTLAIIV